MKIKKIISLIGICLLSACSINSSSTSASTSSNNSSSSLTSVSSSTSSVVSSSSNKENLAENYELKEPDFETPIRNSKEEFTFDDFFNLGNTVLIDVDVSKDELSKLQADYQTGFKSEIYHRADHVSISIINNGVTYTWEYDNVGLRQKGNTSRQSIFKNDDELNQNHFKLSFDETFTDTSMYDASYIAQYGNEEYGDREFLEMSGIDIKWDKNFDSTHIREAYSSYIYHAAGIITPHVGLANMVFNYDGKSHDFGLCMVYEKASKSLVKRSLKEESVVTMTSWSDEKKGTFGVPDENYGDLYKCSYGVGEGGSNGADLTNESIKGKRIGVGNITGSYIPTYERKTNEDVSYDDSLLKKFIVGINMYNATYDDIASLVDLEYLAIEEAVSFIIGNPDAMRYNYNNYMIYMRRTDGKAVIIPIDNDRCFGITKDWNVREAIKNDKILSSATSNGNQRNPLLNKTIFAEDNPCKQLYLDFTAKILDSKWVLNETFNKYFDKAYASYKNYLGSNQEFSLSGTYNITFEEYISCKIKAAKISDTSNDIIDNLYIVGTFNNWGSYSSSELDLYKMEYISKGVYKVEVVIKKVETENNRNYIKFKFNNGYNNYNEIDWTLSSDLKTLNKSVGKSVFVYDVNVNDKLIVTIDVNNNTASVEVK
ncbi:MAG: hypothetical protein IJV94_00545 [Bacilli bacterium]|nr:hypothetical protein [Bacilli bacterium]